MTESRLILRVAGASLAFAAVVHPAAAKTVQIACAGSGAQPVSFTIDYDAKTASGTEGGTYTVPARFTDQTITWTHVYPVGNPNNLFTQTWTLNRVTGWLTVSSPSNLAWTCNEAANKF